MQASQETMVSTNSDTTTDPGNEIMDFADDAAKVNQDLSCDDRNNMFKRLTETLLRLDEEQRNAEIWSRPEVYNKVLLDSCKAAHMAYEREVNRLVSTLAISGVCKFCKGSKHDELESYGISFVNGEIVQACKDLDKKSDKKNKRLNTNVKNETCSKKVAFDGFLKPKQYAKKKIPTQLVNDKLQISNKFSPLEGTSNFNVKDTEQVPIVEETEKSKDSNDKKKTDQPKIPPVMVRFGCTFRQFLGKINDRFPKNETSPEEISCKLSGEFVKIFPRTENEHRELCSFLDQEKLSDPDIEYILITSKNSRPIKAVIKGLPRDTPAQEIFEELSALKFNVSQVTQLTRFKTRQPLPIFQVQLNRDINTPQIFKLTRLMYLTVEVVPFERKGTVNQCYNCQGFRHNSSQCFCKAKCVKCGLNHKSSSCQPPEGFKPKCANCNGQHTASFRGCPMFPKTKIVKQNDLAHRNFIKQGRSFADALGQKKSPQQDNGIKSNSFDKHSCAPRSPDLPQLSEMSPNSNMSSLMEFFNEIQLIVDSIPDLDDMIAKLKAVSNPYDKFLTLIQELSKRRAAQHRP